MESDRASSRGPPGRVVVAEDPDESDYEDVEEMYEGDTEDVEGVEGEVKSDAEVGGGVPGVGDAAEKEEHVEGVLEEVAEEVGGDGVVKKDDQPRAPEAEGEVRLEGEVGGGVKSGEGGVAEKEGVVVEGVGLGGEGVDKVVKKDGEPRAPEAEGEVRLEGEVGRGVEGEGGVVEKEGGDEGAKEVGGLEVLRKDDEALAPKAEFPHDGSKKSDDSSSAVKFVSSTPQKAENNLSSCSRTRSLKKCSQAWNRNPDCAVQPLGRLNQTGCQTPKCFEAPSAQIAPRRPWSSSLGVDEIALKKPAVICDFFAKGWCIKGNSCRFLHKQDETAVAGSMREVGKSKQPTSYELLDSVSDERSKDLSVRQRALVRAYGGEFHVLTKTSSEYCQGTPGTPGTRSYHDSEFNKCSSKEESQYPQYPKEGASYQEVLTGDTHAVPSSGLSSLVRSSAFLNRNYHSDGSSIVNDPNHSGSINHGDGNCPGDCRSQYGQHPYPPYEHRSLSLKSSMESSYTNPHSSLHTSSSVHAFPQPVRPIHNSAILESDHGNVQTIDHDRRYYGSSYIPGITSPYYSKHDSRSSEMGISGLTPPFIEQKSAILEHSWQTSVPFQSSFFSTCLVKTLPDGQQLPPVVGIESSKLVATSVSHSSIDYNKMDEYVTGDRSSENFTSGYWGLKTTESFSNRSYEGVQDKTSLHGVGSYPSILSASQNCSIHKLIPIPENEAQQICHPHDLNIMEKDIGTSVRNKVDKGYNMEPRALKIFRVALIDFVKEIVKPAWKYGHMSKDAHKIIVKKSVEKILGSLQLHEVPSNEESINSYLSTSHKKIRKLVEAYMERYAMALSAEDFKPL